LKGKPFEMFKLRTMRVGTDTVDRKITAEQDDRITPIGRLLRKFEIDELPQFWNVLRGDMSVVGPRPEEYDLVERYYTPEQRRTLEIRPGVVSPFDIHWYPDITYHDPPPAGVSLQDYYITRHLPVQCAEAMEYIDHQSIWLDLQVISQTISCMLVGSWLLPPHRKQLPLLGK
jgi:lipopolysaccharide/colanic/teichoic acid biosynthesis glycosyltransferase